MAEEIKSISNLITFLKKVRKKFDEDIWFRGQSDIDWTLSPGILRLSKTTSESSLLTRFKQSAAMLINKSTKDDFDWLFLMQHYGVPTRLLDWSESPLAALYFAVQNELHDDKDGALWLLKPTELNKIANISTSEKNFIPSFDDEELENYSVKTLSQNPRNKLAPIATIATRNSTRIQAQLGVFTIHHLDNKPIEEFCANSEVIKLKIPAGSKAKLREELSLLEVNKFTLFPELSSIGEILKNKIQ
ncbi:FRG domain-containing protein [Dokdonia ponticola]|uniref:FRG domain-containing protein n=1 Tax=Dokdonia ponticola TaxID=2041041 RepID=A0ABV9HS03_9FLAO